MVDEVDDLEVLTTFINIRVFTRFSVRWLVNISSTLSTVYLLASFFLVANDYHSHGGE